LKPKDKVPCLSETRWSNENMWEHNSDKTVTTINIQNTELQQDCPY